MEEPYDEGVADHIGPKSCAFVRADRGEALTGVCAGRVWSREIPKSRVLTLCNGWKAILRGQRPRARTGTGRSHICLWARGVWGCIGKSEDASQ